MEFTSLLFLSVFLPAAFGLSRLVRPARWKNLMLVILSWVFCAWGSFQDVAVLILVTAFSYLGGLQMDDPQSTPAKRKRALWVCVGFDLAVLGLYKYLVPWLSILGLGQSIHLQPPIGLSFYIFTILSYVFDVYSRKTGAQRNFLSLALYTSFFGKLVMGPISRYAEFENQLAKRVVTRQQTADGISLFFKGLVKKVLIAERMGAVFAALGADLSVLGGWVWILAYTFELYFDFSGYSDMAIGIGSMFGFHIPPNFNHPYMAVSVQDFWRRWHISLSTWFRDYVYIPLGGSRCSRPVYIRNLLVVWVLTGLWHGATLNFVFWGLYYALLLLAQRFVFKTMSEALPVWISRLLTFFLVMVGWIFFSTPDFGSAWMHLGRLFGVGASGAVSGEALFWLSENTLFFVAAALFSTNFYETASRSMISWFAGRSVAIIVGIRIVLLIAVVSVLVSSSAQPFLYAAF